MRVVRLPAHRGKRWLFRLLAMTLALLPFAGAEWLLRALDAGARSEATDPYIGFVDVHPLFIPDGDRMVIDPARAAYFRPDSFDTRKGETEFRIFCLGGSTVQGRPYAIETAFSSWLELSLQAADPSRRWQVVNCGGISYASYRLVPILRELLQYQPDLFIIYTGHNEFLEARTYREVKETPGAVARAHSWCTQFRLYNLIRSAWVRSDDEPPGPDRPVLAAEVDALLDYRGGLSDYRRDDSWRASAVEHFRFNLTRMLQLSADAHVPVLLADPVSNLRDCPPFKYTNDEQLTAQQLSEFEALWDEARISDDARERAELLERALRIDARHAAALFALAKCYEALGRNSRAHELYVRAKDDDICPLRMIEPLHEALRDVARRTRTPLVEVRGKFAALARDGTPGDDWLLDHVHPSINGHQVIARLLLDEIVEQGWLDPVEGWERTEQQAYVAHLDALPAAYYVHGRQRLEGLRAWTQGLAPKMKKL